MQPAFTISETTTDANRREINRALAAITLSLAFAAIALSIKLYEIWEKANGGF